MAGFFHKAFSVSVLTVIPAICASQSVNDAEQLLKDGDCEKAAEMLRTIIASKPKDAEASYQLGMAMICLGKTEEAEEEFQAAKKKGSNDANLQLAELALKKYDTENAEAYIEAYRKGLKKGKKTLEDLSDNFDERLERIDAMLERVEKLIIIDSLDVDADLFFHQYNLAKESGTLYYPPIILSEETHYAEPTVVFETGDKRERFWAIENEDNIFELVSSSAMFGDSWDTPVRLGPHLNEGGDANYPFLMADGMTLYFANDGNNSIGGLDIFITRRDGEEFLQPTNLGLPYNSPYNDYMLAIDETQGIGWWATDRNQNPDKVTIYTFIPSDMRINYDIDDPSLKEAARIESYKATWGDKDYSSLAQKVRNNRIERSTVESPQFKFFIPGKGLYTQVSQFRNPKAKGLVTKYLATEKKIEESKKTLNGLRERYRKGDRSLDLLIIQNENNLEAEIKGQQELKNQIIALETN